jgi:hypothetical protein
MIVCCVHQCDFCQATIGAGQRWVREKIYDPSLSGHEPHYHRYHAEPFAPSEASCWEKRQMEREMAHSAARAA